MEEREAARFGGYRWREWLDLPRSERIDGLAHYRLQHLIDLHQQDAVHADVMRRTNGAKHGV